MGVLLSRSVEMQISNKTQNITLKNARTYLDCGRCSRFPVLELSPGSSDTCHFPGSPPFQGVAGVLAFEADSFTLAIHFSNPMNSYMNSMELGLELCPGKAHLGSLEETYTRMANNTYTSSHRHIQFDRVVVGRSHGTVQVSEGPVKVTATMSSATDSFLRVVLEEQGRSEKEARIEKPRRDIHYQK